MTLARDPEKTRAWQRRSAEKAQAKKRAREKASPPKRKPATPKAAKPRAPKPVAPKTAKKRTALPKRNPKRLAKLRLDQFGTPEQTAMINAMRCVCHDAPMRHPACNDGPSEPSHITTRGAGGKACDQVPQSHGCHLAFHAHGRLTYVRAIGWTIADLKAAAARTWALISSDGMQPDQALYHPA